MAENKTLKYTALFQKAEEFSSTKSGSETWYFNASFMIEDGGVFRYFVRKEGNTAKPAFNVQRAIKELKFGDKVELEIGFRFTDDGNIFSGLEKIAKKV